MNTNEFSTSLLWNSKFNSHDLWTVNWQPVDTWPLHDYQLMKLQNTHFQENEEGLKELLRQTPKASLTWLHHPYYF